MCGRYYVDESIEQEVQELTGEKDFHMKSGDIHPSETATVLKEKGDALTAADQIWGFPGYEEGHLLINARAETIIRRPSFRDSVMSRRCVIPAKGFYEWSPKKEKYQFEDPGKALFMAGCFDEQYRFVIITTAANDSVQPVHERMPLLLATDEIRPWLHDPESMKTILKKTPQTLDRWTPYEQMNLFE